MDAEQTKAQVTELFVPMDCNGCVQKIKRALNNLDGIYEVYMDVAQQKLTVVGRVEPEKIEKVVKKTRKTATLCPPNPSSTETSPPEPEASAEPPNQAAGDATPPLDPPKEVPSPENPTPDVKPLPESSEAATAMPKEVEEIHMVHYYPHNSIYRGSWNSYPRAFENRQEASPHYVVQSYNNYRPSPYSSEYAYINSLAQRPKLYGDGNCYNQQGGDGSQITSIFSDENPNACRIV